MVRLLASFVVGAIALSGCGPEHTARVRPLPAPDNLPALRGAGPARSPRIANYKIDARLDVVQHQITATQTLTWRNTGAQAVSVLPFHMYLNAFKNESSRFMQSSHGTMRGAKQTTWGWISVESVQVGGAELISKWTAKADYAPDESVYELALPNEVAPGASVDVTMKFTAQLPEVWARTGYAGEFHLVGQWFPKIGVRVTEARSDETIERWECQPFSTFTEFFADFGTYDVSLTVPETYVVAATGVLTAAIESPGNTRTYTYRAEDVHDFGWMADPYMERLERQVLVAGGGAVDVRVYYRPAQEEFAQRHLDAATAAMIRFSDWFVPYPWAVMTVIDPPPEAAKGAGGMEYPTFVTTAGDTVFARDGIRLPEYVTVHEVGHNWFQGILASNEPIEAWLDEGVNSWADANVMAEVYGTRTSGVDWMGWQADVSALIYAVYDDPDAVPVPIATAAAAFIDEESYGMATYFSTQRALHTLENTFGPKKFRAAMKKYAETWAFKHPTGKDLFDTLSAELGQDLGWFFGPVFEQVGGMRYGIRTAACRRAHPPRGVFGDGPSRKTTTKHDAKETGTFVCEVVITNTGVVHIPIDIELRFADGTSQRVRWEDKDGETWKRFVVERTSELAEVWIDPDREIVLQSPVTMHYRLVGDGRPAWRAAAWIGAQTQTLMQLVGP
ncbi:MAG: M1 family metallopeptidase [Kofleriaceae bacterium]